MLPVSHPSSGSPPNTMSTRQRCFVTRPHRNSQVVRAVSQRGPEDSHDREERTRREFILQSVNFAILGDLVGTGDARTIVNSILGAYGLPQMKASKGFKLYDEFEAEYTFEYPTSWVSRPNSQRAGIYISDFNTADKLTVEVFPAVSWGGQAALQEAMVKAIVDPANQSGGDSKLFMPSLRSVKSEERDIDGKRYTYLYFPSETITRSGYQVKRKNFAVAAEKRGQVYCLGTSARSDQYNPEKEQLLQHVIDSFRLR